MRLHNQKGLSLILLLIIVLAAVTVMQVVFYLSKVSNQPTKLSVNIPPCYPGTLTPLPNLDTSLIHNPNSKIGKGSPKIGIAYHNRTDFSNPSIKANTDSDIQHVTKIFSNLPIIGYLTVSLSSQNRYGYNFPAVNQESSATYEKVTNQLFVNMDESQTTDHVILHETAHYLSVRQNSENLTPYLTQSFSEAALQAEKDLLSCIRKYDKNPTMQASDENLANKLKTNSQVTWQEIVDASNVYPSQIYQNSSDFLQFRNSTDVDINQVKTRADDELYAEFSAFLIEAQTAGLFDNTYQHPVYRIFAAIKN